MSAQLKSRMLRAAAHWLVRWSQRLFLAIGIAALGYCGFVLADARLYQAYESSRFEQSLKTVRSGGRTAHVPASTPLIDATPARETWFPTAGPAETPLGRIEIGTLGVEAMIMEGTDDKTLRRAVGHIAGTALPGQRGNVALAGHRDTFFRGLRKVRKNDEIVITTLEGASRYTVDSTEVVAPEDIRVLDASSNAILTLVTCYPFNYTGAAPKRFVVRAHRIER